jgi:aminoglycoside phosphotransferase (APT) family kinase protein/adenylate kinase family enzyme
MTVQKVAIIASASGNGKTTLGRELARRLRVPFVELDGLVHGPDWIEIADDDLRAQLEPIVVSEGWVIDGTYHRKLGDLVLDAADVVVWLDLPIRVWLPRLGRRTWRRVRGREELWNGNRESLVSALWGRESLFAWALRTHFRRRREWPQTLAHLHVVRLRTLDEVERFLAESGVGSEGSEIVTGGMMHADELETNEALVRQLLVAQFPQWAELPIEALPAGGTDNAIYRLGDDLSVRLPRRADWAPGSSDKEFQWLPKLAPLLPVSVPTPVARGAPGEGYPNGWAIYNWLEGEDAASTPLDLPHAAVDLAELLDALRQIDPTGGPPPGGRGGSLRPRDEDTRSGIAALGDLIDPAAVTAAWEAALAAPEWDRARVWIHGDLDPRNLLVRDGRITGLLDWSSMCVGDPACDVKVAWAVLDAETRPVFRELLEIDDATWARGRGWALSQAMIALPYYLHTYPVMVEQAWRWLGEALADS